MTKFLTKIYDEGLSPKGTWLKLITFLEREKRVHQQKSLLNNQSNDGIDQRKSFHQSNSKHQPQAYNSLLQSYLSSTPSTCQSLAGNTSECEYHKISNLQCNDRGIYLLQRILVDEKQLLVFFDNGCSNLLISKDAVNKLSSRCVKESSNPIVLGGVGNSLIESSLGMY